MLSFKDFYEMCSDGNLEEILPLEKVKPVWIFGAGNFAQDVCSAITKEGFNFQGFIVSDPEQSKILEFPVVGLNNFPVEERDVQLVFGVFNRNTPFDDLKGIIQQQGFNNIFMPWHIYPQFESHLGWRYWLSGKNAITNELDQIEQVYELLDDDTSKQCLLNICLFRLGMNDNYASFIHDEDQYFNNITLEAASDKPLSYVDMGAYNGDTVIELSKKANLASAYLFEPDSGNFNDLVKAVSKLNIKSTCIPLGIADNYKILSFSSDGGEGSLISEEGNLHIAVAPLDDILINQSIDFIKMDIEGAELLALAGAKKSIEKNRPILAISYYHKPDDIWKIPLWLSEHCDNYKFYLRQHHYNSFESVLYAVPVY